MLNFNKFMSNHSNPTDNSDLLPLQVAKMQLINFEGNIIPHTWYKQLTYKNGRVHLPAIVVLSEICYWYRPTVIKDEESGVVLGYRKKFRADKLQKSYASFENFGLTRQQARNAITLLKNLKLISTETRTTLLHNGQKLPNQLFLEINADQIAELNNGTLFDQQNSICSTEQIVCSTEHRVGFTEQTVCSPEQIVCSSEQTMCSTEQTNTENTTEITTEISKEITQRPLPLPKKGGREVFSKFSYEEWFAYIKYCKEILHEPIESIEAVAESNYYKGIRDSRLEAWQKEQNEKKAEPVINQEELKFVLRFCPQCFGAGLKIDANKVTVKCDHSEITDKLAEAVNENEIDRELVERFHLFQAQKIPSTV